MILSKLALYSLALISTRVLAQEPVQDIQHVEQIPQFEYAIVPNNTVITKLTLGNFASFIKEYDVIIGEFTVPWCLHSKILLPELLKAAEILDSTKGIKTFQVDCSEDEVLCQQLQIPYYPSLKVFRNHRLIKDNEYTGRRTADDIVDFMVNHVSSPVKNIDSEEQLNDFYLNPEKMTEPVVVRYGNVEGFNATFEKAANDLFNSFTFVSYANCNDTMKDQVVLYLVPQTPEEIENEKMQAFEVTARPEEQSFVYEQSASVDADDFKAWLQYSKLPYFDNANIDNYRLYMESGLPLAYYFYLTLQEYTDNKDLMVNLAKKYRGKMNFLAFNGLLFHSHTTFLNMRPQFPLFAIHDLPHNMKYGLPQLSEEDYKKIELPEELNQDDIIELVEQFINGTASPIVKSEEIPADQGNVNVTKIVGDNHDVMVRNDDKDVIVRYYAPWCAHSKKIEPIFYDIADLFARDEDTKDKITFFDIDATANDVISFPVTGYPTVAIYPAGSKGDPIIFTGARIRNNLLVFIKKNGKHQLDGISLLEKYSDDTEEITIDNEMLGDVDESEKPGEVQAPIKDEL